MSETPQGGVEDCQPSAISGGSPGTRGVSQQRSRITGRLSRALPWRDEGTALDLGTECPLASSVSSSVHGSGSFQCGMDSMHSHVVGRGNPQTCRCLLFPNKASAPIGNLESANALVGHGGGRSVGLRPWEPREAVGSAMCPYVKRRGLGICIPQIHIWEVGPLGERSGQEGEPLRWDQGCRKDPGDALPPREDTGTRKGSPPNTDSAGTRILTSGPQNRKK